MSTNDIISLRLHYFPFPGRAQSIRDALNIGGIEFTDEHLDSPKFREQRNKGELPFGMLPVLDITTESGTMRVGQSNAILRFAGRLSGLYPVDDALQALKVDEALDLGEDINSSLSPSLYESDETKKMAMRKVLAEQTFPFMATCFERLLVNNGSTGFIVGNELTVADLKLYWIVDWLTSGILDGIPKTLFDNFPTICAWRKNITAVRESRLA